MYTNRNAQGLHDGDSINRSYRLWIWEHIISKLSLFISGATFTLAAAIRLWAAPLSAGPDVAQFWAFARVFQLHSIDFYRYADAALDIFPFKHWGFIYPPVWLYSLRFSLLTAPSSQATDSMVDIGWRIAMKLPIIAADLAIGALIFWVVSGSRFRKLLFASLWLFNPVAWYESGVFGQFDSIATAFLLASIITFERKKYWLAFPFAGLALMTKQHILVALVIMLAISFRHLDRRRLFKNCLIAAGVMMLLSVPFLLNGDLVTYASMILATVQKPGYQYPLIYSFSGSGSLITYLHEIFRWEISNLLQISTPLMLSAVFAAAIFSYRSSLTFTRGALIGLLLFIGISYHIHYQYLIIYIPVAILAAAGTGSRWEKVLAIGLAFLPSLWLWFFDTSFWFNYFSPASPWVAPVLARIGMGRHVPDYAYVFLAMAIALLSLTYVGLIIFRWRSGNPHRNSSPPPYYR